ncbi:MAG: Gfo/Idh/MocA family protein [Eubacteriales bacterium]
MGIKYRVGILGTENSHAMAFARHINLPDQNGNLRYPDFRVTALYAAEKKPSEDIAAACGDDIKIFDSVEAMTGEVDCVMVTARHGKYHLPFSLPFIEKGCPVFIDKPFTISSDDTHLLIDAAQKAGVPLCGGSGCKYSRELLALKDELDSGRYGAVTSAVLNFPADINSEYGGFYFYASHLVEMTTALFGPDVMTVNAMEKNGYLTAVAGYEKFNVMMNFAKNGRYYAVVYCEKEIIIREIGIADIYSFEVDHFVEMVRTGVSPVTIRQLTAPVFIMNAIERSLESGKTEKAEQQ